MKNILYISLLFFSNLILTQDYHVAKNGDDSNPGTKDKPFLTISKAAKIALPGSVITVHKGIYRERIDPSYGGASNTKRIVYKAAEDEEVWIKGSEIIKGWKKYNGNIWVVEIDNQIFGDFNPYQEIVEGDWLINDYGRDHHLGEVYLNGNALYENDSVQKLMEEKPMKRAKDQEASKYQWYCKSDDEKTISMQTLRV